MTTESLDRIATEAAERMTETIRKAVEHYASAYAAAGDLETRLRTVVAEAKVAGWVVPHDGADDIGNFGGVGLFSDGVIHEISFHSRKGNWHIKVGGELRWSLAREAKPDAWIVLVKPNPPPRFDDEESD
jgi:hypothetical protein